jgi:hypothetical protein
MKLSPPLLVLALFGCATSPDSDERLNQSGLHAAGKRNYEFNQCHIDYGQNRATEVVFAFRANLAGEVTSVDVTSSGSWPLQKLFNECLREEFQKVRLECTYDCASIVGTITKNFKE